MRYLLLIPVIALLIGCGEKKETPAEVSARIRAMEDSLFQSLTFDKRRALAMIDVYKAYANANPYDTISAQYLLKAANLAKSMHDGEQSVKLYERIMKDFPSWKRLPDVMYLKAFTIDSELDQKGEAEAAYREVISKYPDHPFAKDARAMIENLKYTDEELIQRFQAMQDSVNGMKGDSALAQ
jgi:outer membrane protein assembly factor BamD (BamD/ComL family)